MMEIHSLVRAFCVLLALTPHAYGIRCYVCNSSSILNRNTNCETPLHHLLPTECPNTCEYCDYFKINAHTLGFDFGTVYRGCSENSSWLRQSVAFEKTIANIVTLSYRSCDTDLCNGDYWDRSSLLRNKQFTKCASSTNELIVSVIEVFFPFLLITFLH